jgi:1,4-dihydroxy-2-naphthoate octaprenyltransferase
MAATDVSAQAPSMASGHALLPKPGSFGAWILAARPQTLVAGAVPVAVGSACAYALGGFRLAPALGALFGALCLQVGCNFANDVFDHEKGADTAERLGPMRAVQTGLLSPRAMRIGMLIVFGLALAVGIYLTSVAGVAIVVIGLLSIASAIAYTGGPYPLGYHGFGDLFVLLFFGFVAVCGTAFVELGRVPALAVLAALPVGTLSTAILVVNNLRDLETDARAGKRTLAVRFGRRITIVEYRALLLAAYAVPVALVLSGQLGPLALLPLGAAPLAARLALRIGHERGRELNPLLAATARHLLLFGALFSVGIALGTRL